MGLFDKVKDAVSGLRPDHEAVLQEQLGQERYLGHVPVMASAAESDGPSKTPHDLTSLAQQGAQALTDSFVENRHIGGDEGSIARKLPRSTEPLVLTLADGSVTLWKFGLGAKKNAPDLIARVPREQVASIADTGKRKARGHVRVSFTDGSFFDYQTLTAASEQFWQAADSYDPA